LQNIILGNVPARSNGAERSV